MVESDDDGAEKEDSAEKESAVEKETTLKRRHALHRAARHHLVAAALQPLMAAWPRRSTRTVASRKAPVAAKVAKEKKRAPARETAPTRTLREYAPAAARQLRASSALLASHRPRLCACVPRAHDRARSGASTCRTRSTQCVLRRAVRALVDGARAG